MTTLLLVLPVFVLVLCALSDIQRFKIPNRYVAVLLAAWPPVALLAGASLQEMGLAAALGGLVLVAGFALFALGLLGAGDVKLLSATALWVGPAQMPFFVLTTALIGGGLGVVLLTLRAQPLPVFATRYGWLVEMHARTRAMPYGVAIAAGGILAMAQGVAVH